MRRNTEKMRPRQEVASGKSPSKAPRATIPRNPASEGSRVDHAAGRPTAVEALDGSNGFWMICSSDSRFIFIPGAWISTPVDEKFGVHAFRVSAEGYTSATTRKQQSLAQRDVSKTLQRRGGDRHSTRSDDDDVDNEYGGTDNEVEVDDGLCDESAIAETPNSRGWLERSGCRSLGRPVSRPLITEKAWCFDEFKSFLVTR